jgi:hypothetical protein
VPLKPEVTVRVDRSRVSRLCFPLQHAHRHEQHTHGRAPPRLHPTVALVAVGARASAQQLRLFTDRLAGSLSPLSVRVVRLSLLRPVLEVCTGERGWSRTNS